MKTENGTATVTLPAGTVGRKVVITYIVKKNTRFEVPAPQIIACIKETTTGETTLGQSTTNEGRT